MDCNAWCGVTAPVSEAIGTALAGHGVDAVFGVIGSGNMAVTNALHAGGAAYYAARHEGGAVCMADGYARVSGKVGVLSVHQGPGLTNAMTGLTEAAKSRTPLLVLAADTPSAALRSNFRIDQAAMVEAVGAVAERVHGPATAVADALRALRRAREERRAVVLNMALDVQAAEVAAPAGGAAHGGASAPGGAPSPAPPLARPQPAASVIAEVAELLAQARRPVLLAGRGAVLAGAGDALRRLGDATGALLATSAVANGLFAGDPWYLGISGGFSSPTTARLMAEADLIVAFGAAMNHWTTRHGALVGPDARVVQVELDAEEVGAHRPVDVGVVGDARAAAEALLATATDSGQRTEELRATIAAGGWRQEPYDDASKADVIDPRTLSLALEELLPVERTLVVDSGHFMGWPSMYLSVPDAHGFVFPQAFQCVGLGLATAIGAALARPDRLTVATLGDGGALMSASELETLARLRLPMLVVVYDDNAYGAEVHHFRPLGQPVELAQFPDADIAALARGAGCEGAIVRTPGDLEVVTEWLARRDGPLVLDAKVDPGICAEWLEEAFKAG